MTSFVTLATPENLYESPRPNDSLLFLFLNLFWRKLVPTGGKLPKKNSSYPGQKSQ